MKLCKNMAAFGGLKKIEHGDRCHGVKKFKIQTVQRILLKLDTKIDHHSQLCSFLNFQNGRHFKMATNIKIKKIAKNSKMNRFGRNLVSK